MTERAFSRPWRLAVVLLLNLGLVTALVVVGLAAHSLAVLAAGADYLADAAAIGVSLLAIWLASRPRGHPNATTVAALVNAGWLLILNVGIAVAAIQHLATGAHRVEGLPVLIVSAIAAVVMLAGALILGGDADDDDGEEDLNVKAVLLDTAADAAAAAGVAVSGAVILAVGGWYWLDPTTALVIAVIVGYHALNLTRKVIRALRFPLRTLTGYVRPVDRTPGVAGRDKCTLFWCPGRRAGSAPQGRTPGTSGTGRSEAALIKYGSIRQCSEVLAVLRRVTQRRQSWMLAFVNRCPSGDGDGSPAVPAAYRETQGEPEPVLFTLDVEGERFAIRWSGDGGTGYDWLNGRNKGYGFSSSGSPNRSIEKHRESIRVFLGMIDPHTGYIGDD